jgi:hypothetical protein
MDPISEIVASTIHAKISAARFRVAGCGTSAKTAPGRH